VTIPEGKSNSFLPMLSRLTHLVHLDVGAGSYGDCALLTLTALRQLTELRVACYRDCWTPELKQRLNLPLDETASEPIYVYHRVCEVRGAV
jgi:siroheme synthase